ncbi:MAG TPA: hypothetical protein VEZ51_08945 [Gemmatimonadaceae bacterium]|nr:hypothetical protein [Gemmatimonadaceae bacterium]
MTEQNFEEFLKKSAQGYNAPPVRVPREEMWSAIQAKRSSGPQVVYGGGATYLIRHRFGTKAWLGAAAAAMLLVATGVGIGRWSATRATRQNVASALPQQPVVVNQPANEGVGSSQPGEASIPSAGTTRTAVERGGERGGKSSVTAVAGANGVALPAPAPAALAPATATPAYQLATVQHLSDAEALLTSFRQRSTADQQMDAQLGTWARQLLSNTRLLLDSPVANDPQRRPLLEDLELVLVQIVQLSPGSTPQDRALIEKTLQQDHVMTRLRTAIPAGAQRGS